MADKEPTRPDAPISGDDVIRKTYMAFRIGAGLRDGDVDRLLCAAGIVLSANRLHELGRASHRGSPITMVELYAVISGWATEQRNKTDH